TAVFLPPYSPDFNPIEQAFAKLKSGLRKENPRSIDTVCEAIDRILDRFTSAECANYFVNSGYGSA
nr:transposase [Alphaproteobacteria bacterium]